MDYKLFWHLNPTKLKAFNKAYKISFQNRMKEEEAITYWNGVYVAQAISSCFNKRAKFPKKPIEFIKTEEIVQRELTDEEKMQQVENVFRKIRVKK